MLLRSLIHSLNIGLVFSYSRNIFYSNLECPKYDGHRPSLRMSSPSSASAPSHLSCPAADVPGCPAAPRGPWIFHWGTLGDTDQLFEVINILFLSHKIFQMQCCYINRCQIRRSEFITAKPTI